MTDEELNQKIKQSGLTFNEYQIERLRDLFERLEHSELSWGKCEIKMQNDMPVLEVSFVIS